MMGLPASMALLSFNLTAGLCRCSDFGDSSKLELLLQPLEELSVCYQIPAYLFCTSPSLICVLADASLWVSHEEDL